MNRAPIAIALAALVVLSASACRGVRDKAGGDVAPITLIANGAAPLGTPGGDALEQFARRASALSGGAVKVSIDWSQTDTSRDNLDPVIVSRVRSGKAAIGMVAARTFDTLGVTSLRALQAPFLITSDRLANAVARDRIADQMLGGLSKVGLDGLTLLPETLRHPIAHVAPLLGPDDFRGVRIAARPSRTTEALLRALGALPTTANGPRLLDGVEKGTIGALESSLSSASPFDFGDLIATGNVTFFAKYGVVVVSRKIFDRLSDSQRDVLRRAALETRDWSIAHRPSDQEFSRLWCKQGGTIRDASATDVAAFGPAAAPVTNELERDPSTAAAIARIREIEQGLGPQPTVRPCGTHPVPAVVPLAPRGDQSVLDGVWRLRVSGIELRAAGVSKEVAFYNDGIWTFTIHAGDVRADQNNPHNPCRARIAISGDRLSWTWDGATGCIGDFRGTFSRRGNVVRIVATAAKPGEVTFSNIFFRHGLHLLGEGP